LDTGDVKAAACMPKNNLDAKTVEGFGVEWTQFDQSKLTDREFEALFDQYFRIFDFGSLPAGANGFDAGCGSGRWARGVAPRVGVLHCVDASDAALAVARKTLSQFPNCRFHCASISEMPFADGSMDFGYSLGVLHHLPDPAEGLKSCVAKLKPGAPFLVYLYYAFDNKRSWYTYLWRVSNLCRFVISRQPKRLRMVIADVTAVGVYWPLARIARLAERRGYDVSSFPLAFYRTRSLYTMRTDSLDRLGTRIEHRFTKKEIMEMMHGAGLNNLRFSEAPPYWCAVGWRV
jgi:ubiquinone/menaquinone biosynthesis C-methylase UbiE